MTMPIYISATEMVSGLELPLNNPPSKVRRVSGAMMVGTYVRSAPIVSGIGRFAHFTTCLVVVSDKRSPTASGDGTLSKGFRALLPNYLALTERHSPQSLQLGKSHLPLCTDLTQIAALLWLAHRFDPRL